MTGSARIFVALWGAVLITAPHAVAPPSHAAADLAGANLATATSSPAPVPDLSVGVPTGAQDPGPAASVRPGISRPGLGPDGRSQGYTPHSSYTDSLDGRFHAMPTLNLSVKLQ